MRRRRRSGQRKRQTRQRRQGQRSSWFLWIVQSEWYKSRPVNNVRVAANDEHRERASKRERERDGNKIQLIARSSNDWPCLAGRCNWRAISYSPSRERERERERGRERESPLHACSYAYSIHCDSGCLSLSPFILLDGTQWQWNDRKQVVPLWYLVSFIHLGHLCPRSLSLSPSLFVSVSSSLTRWHVARGVSFQESTHQETTWLLLHFSI